MLGIAFIAAGIYFLTLDVQNIAPYGVVIIIFGFLYYGKYSSTLNEILITTIYILMLQDQLTTLLVL